MIVRDQPAAWRLFLVMRGSIVPHIWHKILAVSLLSAALVALDHFAWTLPSLPLGGIGVFGLALSLFLGFRNNAAYDRWWEARKLWGDLIGDIRAMGREVIVFCDDKDRAARILTGLAGFIHLHRGALRGVDAAPQATTWLGPDACAACLAHRSPPNEALRRIARDIATSDIDGFGRMTLIRSLDAIGRAQSSCERIATTPLPFVYSLLVRRTTYLYCFLLPFALSAEAGWFTPLIAAIVAYMFFGLQTTTSQLETPFSNGLNALPLDALCRTIEISVCEALDRPAPEPLQPHNHVLT